MLLTEDIMHTHFYDKVDEYNNIGLYKDFLQTGGIQRNDKRLI